MRIAITLLLIVLMGTSHAQQPALRSALGGKPAVAATVDVAEERAKLETQLGETLRQREAELPGARETASADSVRAADRQRLLDRLAFLQGERIKRLDELGALQKAPPFTLASLPVVHAIGATPPYSALAVDALRDELAGVQDKVQALDSGLSARESEKQILVEQLRRADEALRLAADRLALTGNDGNGLVARWEHEQVELRRRTAEAELALLAIDIDKLKLQKSAFVVQAQEMQALVAKVLPAQRISEQDLKTLKERTTAAEEKLREETDKVRRRQSAHEKEQKELSASGPPTDGERLQRVNFLKQALIIEGNILEGLNGLQLLAQVRTDIWEKRYLGQASNDMLQQRQMLLSFNKIHQGLVSRKRLSLEQREASAVAIRDLETKVANLPPGSTEQQLAREEWALLQEQISVHERLESAASRLERQLSRWLADFNQNADGSLTGRAGALGDQLHETWRAFWQYELFAVEDVSDVDGRKVSVFYGITVGKSVGALLLFVVGYWLFSRLSHLLSKILVSRFGISNQLASVIRRWMMILLALGLIVFILNLARIPLTVFAFMGGALAIGVGFGTQTIIKNFISGIIILFERKIRVGDIIELGGMTGHVTAVDLRATTVRGFNGVEALVPNSSFLENQVVNWTYSNQQLRRELKVGVAYGSDSEATTQLLIKAACDHQKVLKTPAPEVYFEDFADSALLMVLIYWVELGPGTVARRVDSDLRHTIYRRLAEAGIAIPFPQRDVHLDWARPVPVIMMDGAS